MKAMEQRYNRKNIDLKQLYDYCEQHGEVACYEKGEQMEQEGKQPKWFAFVKKGYFKYMVRGISNGRDHIAWFSFEDEIVGDYPNLLYGNQSQFTIEAVVPCTVVRISCEQLYRFFNMNSENMMLHVLISNHILCQFQARYLDFHRATPKERYKLLIRRCPGITKDLTIQEIASFLKISPGYLSTIRKEITFSNDK